jgi:hypothetical protein
MGHVARLARSAVASSDPQCSLRSLLRLYSFLIAAWAECRLQKLLHEEFGFQATERDEILAESTQLKQWQLTVDTAFRKHHGITKAPLNERSLGVAHAARRDARQDVLNHELRIPIEIRNKLAHGQWVYPFNTEGSVIDADKYRLINKENIQSLQLKFAPVGHFADAVHDLVVSPRTFERDFESHFRRLFQARTNLTTKAYSDYEQSLQNSRRASRSARKEAG